MMLDVMEPAQIIGRDGQLEVMPLIAAALFCLMAAKRFLWVRRIARPVVGFLNLAGQAGADFLEEDQTALQQVFPETASFGGGPVGRCDVLFVYGGIDAEGGITNSPASLKDIAAASRCAILILAMPDTAEAYARVPRTALGNLNLVFTVDRNGTGFPRFFRQVFSEMMTGKPLAAAWKKIAPQSLQADHRYFPVTHAFIKGKLGFK